MTESDVARASVEVPLDRGEAFEAFTAEIGDWFVINRFTVPDDVNVETVRIEPCVGGRLIYVESPSTGEGATAGQITRWVPPRGFTFVDRRGLEVTVTFVAIENGCRVTVEERGFEQLTPDVARQVRRHSWHRHLPAWFEQHTTQRRAMTGMDYAVAELTAAVKVLAIGGEPLQDRLQRAWEAHYQNLWTSVYLPEHLNVRFKGLWESYTAPSDDRFSTRLRAMDDAELAEAASALVDLAVDTAGAAARGEQPPPSATADQA